MVQRPGDEARVQKVQHGVLDAADILIDRHPVVGGRPVDRLDGRRVGEAGEIPRRVDKGVERVGFAPSVAAAMRAFDVLPRRMAFQGIAGHVEGDVLGQGDGQLVVRHRHDATRRAVDDRDRTAPIALPRYAPVTQAENGRAFAEAHGLDLVDRRRLGGFDIEAVEEFGVEDVAGAGIGFIADREGVGVGALRQDDRADGQGVFAGEIQVALIVGRAAEDGAGAVVHKHEIGDPYRQGLTRLEGVGDGEPGVEAQLFGRVDIRLGYAAPVQRLDEFGQLGIGLRAGLGQRVVGGDGDKAGAEQGVRASGVDFHPIAQR